MKFLKKLGLAVMGFVGLANTAFAAVTVDPATGAISGALELNNFYSGAAVIMTALGAIIVIKWVMSLLRRA